MINISIKHLRYFEALARLGHFGRAAEDCAISQPALSVQIKDLEAMLGAPLVERGPKSIRVTGLGEEVAHRAREILRSVEELGDLARASNNPLIGRLRLGVIPTIAPYFLPAVIRTLNGEYPDLDIRPREAVTQHLIQDLLDAKLDAAIVALPVSEPTLHEEPLFEEEFVLVRPQHDADKPVPNADMLREMRLLLLEEGHCFRDQALSFCNISAATPRELMEGSSLSTLVQMVGAGIGVTLIPEMAIAIDTQCAPVCVARFADPRPTRSIGMVWRKNSLLSDHLMSLSQIVRGLSA
jgi:LysR family hydrogen peroxide-inducible transcriptional activator